MWFLLIAETKLKKVNFDLSSYFNVKYDWVEECTVVLSQHNSWKGLIGLKCSTHWPILIFQTKINGV